VTGIKVVDLLAPYARGGKIGLFGGAGVGKTVLIMELIANVAKKVTLSRTLSFLVSVLLHSLQSLFIRFVCVYTFSLYISNLNCYFFLCVCVRVISMVVILCSQVSVSVLVKEMISTMK
jgi:hypothetical protein